MDSLDMKLLLLAVLLVVTASCLFADTTFVAAGGVSGDWTQDHNPFIVATTIFVNDNDTLSIDPGVRVFFSSFAQLQIYGVLKALGTEQDSITFTTDTLTNPGGWSGIIFQGPMGSSYLYYCIIEGIYGIQRDGLGIHCVGAELQLLGCTIRNNRRGGLSCWDQSIVRLLDCVVTDNNGGLSLYNNSNATLQKCTISRNFYMDGGGIKANQSTLAITECSFIANHCNIWGGAIFVDECDATVTRCTFSDNVAAQGGGICAFGASDSTKIIQCTFVGNNANSSGGGLWLGTRSVINSSIVTFNRMGAGIYLGSNVSVHHCDVFGNVGGDFSGEVGNRGQLDRLNHNGDQCDPYYNVFLDPQFVDSLNDYHLASLSPCIDAGDSGLPNDPDSTIADIGAFSFQHPEKTNNPFILQPSSFSLSSYPNPFNSSTTISFSLSVSGTISLKIYNLLGQETTTLQNGLLQTGLHSVPWNAIAEPSGIYFAVLDASHQHAIQELVLIK